MNHPYNNFQLLHIAFYYVIITVIIACEPVLLTIFVFYNASLKLLPGEKPSRSLAIILCPEMLGVQAVVLFPWHNPAHQNV